MLNSIIGCVALSSRQNQDSVDKNKYCCSIWFVTSSMIYSYDTKDSVGVVPTDVPAFVMFSGYKTLYSRIVLHDLCRYANLFEHNDINTNVYGLLYQIPDTFSRMSRKTKERISLSTFLVPSMYFRNYIKGIFDILVVPRIQSKNGEKLPLDVAERNMRNLTIFAYCYGAYVVNCLYEVINKHMKHLHYTNEEISCIFKQLVIITQSPSYILCDKKFTILNFASAKDRTVLYNTMFPSVKGLTYFPEYDFIVQPQVYDDDYISANLKHKKDVEHRLWTFDSCSYILEYNVINLLQAALCNSMKAQTITDNDSLLKSYIDYSVQHIKNDEFDNKKMVIRSWLKRFTRYK